MMISYVCIVSYTTIEKKIIHITERERETLRGDFGSVATKEGKKLLTVVVMI
jgi:hypothetical protein